MQIVETIKSHPKLLLASVAGFVVLVYFLNHQGGSAGTTGSYTVDETSAATAFQNAQLAASAQASQAASAVQANKDTLAAQSHIAELQFQYAGAHDQLAAEVATSQISANQQLQSLLGQLSANVAIHAQDTDLGKTTVVATNQTEQQRILANALVEQGRTQAQVAQAGYAAQAEIASHRGGLFGGGGFLGLGI